MSMRSASHTRGRRRLRPAARAPPLARDARRRRRRRSSTPKRWPRSRRRRPPPRASARRLSRGRQSGRRAERRREAESNGTSDQKSRRYGRKKVVVREASNSRLLTARSRHRRRARRSWRKGRACFATRGKGNSRCRLRVSPAAALEREEKRRTRCDGTASVYLLKISSAMLLARKPTVLQYLVRFLWISSPSSLLRTEEGTYLR